MYIYRNLWLEQYLKSEVVAKDSNELAGGMRLHTAVGWGFPVEQRTS
jgi:hypothetical protein